MALRTDYKNDELNTAVNTERQFEEVTNPNGTKSYRDVTDYSQVGDSFDADLVNAQNAEINAKAPLDSPAFTGNPTAPTQSQSTSDDTIATTAYVKSAFSNIIDPNLRTSGKAADAQVTGNRIAAVQASIPAIDTTLTTNGAAADAKAVGDALSSIVATGSIRTVENTEELLDTTEERVLVLHNDSNFGNGGATVYEYQGTKRFRDGTVRNDGTRVYPAICESGYPTANAPYHEIMAVLKSWIGRTDIIHTDNSGLDYTTLFGSNCVADSDGKYHLDCSTFISALLLGITFENSRFVLGNDADNIRTESYTVGKFPPSVRAMLPKGGLGAAELAQFFAHQNRLFYTGTDYEKMYETLQFGDLLFGSDENGGNVGYYNAIQHVAFVLGTVKTADNYYVVVCHCNSSVENNNEGVACGLRWYNMENILYLKYFARPNYHTKNRPFDSIVPKTDSSYKYNGAILPMCELVLDTSTTTAHRIASQPYGNYSMLSTADFYPVAPGSSIEYTGALANSRGTNYGVRLFEYDKNLNPVKRGATIAAYGTGRGKFTLDSNTAFVKFSYGDISGKTKVYLADVNDFEITITPSGTIQKEIKELQGRDGILTAFSKGDIVLDYNYAPSSFGRNGDMLYILCFSRTSDIGKCVSVNLATNQIVGETETYLAHANSCASVANRNCHYVCPAHTYVSVTDEINKVLKYNSDFTSYTEIDTEYPFLGVSYDSVTDKVYLYDRVSKTICRLESDDTVTTIGILTDVPDVDDYNQDIACHDDYLYLCGYKGEVIKVYIPTLTTVGFFNISYHDGSNRWQFDEPEGWEFTSDGRLWQIMYSKFRNVQSFGIFAEIASPNNYVKMPKKDIADPGFTANITEQSLTVFDNNESFFKHPNEVNMSLEKFITLSIQTNTKFGTVILETNTILNNGLCCELLIVRCTNVFFDNVNPEWKVSIDSINMNARGGIIVFGGYNRRYRIGGYNPGGSGSVLFFKTGVTFVDENDEPDISGFAPLTFKNPVTFPFIVINQRAIHNPVRVNLDSNFTIEAGARRVRTYIIDAPTSETYDAIVKSTSNENINIVSTRSQSNSQLTIWVYIYNNSSDAVTIDTLYAQLFPYGT